ncbi:MAG TPA: tetratricopeptide repeat protein [Phycisphaerae bacterium]|nr:tetratricopeptide repeat protein [Phycisphaerae bacterium]
MSGTGAWKWAAVLLAVAPAGCRTPPGPSAGPGQTVDESPAIPVDVAGVPEPAGAEPKADEPTWVPAVPVTEPAPAHGQAVPRGDLADPMQRGHQAFAQEDFDAAAQAFQQAVDLDPALPEAHHWLGVSLRKLGRLDESLAESLEALRLRPDYAEAHGNVGNVYYRKGDHGTALERLLESVRLNPDYAEGHLTLGVVLYAEGRFDQAVARYRRAIELDPDSVLAHNNLGIALDAQGDYDDAIAAFGEALNLDPDYAVAHAGLGKSLWEAGWQEQAVLEFLEAARLRPDFAVARVNLIQTFYELGRYAEAWENVHAARLHGVEVPEALVQALSQEMPDPSPPPPPDDAAEGG